MPSGAVQPEVDARRWLGPVLGLVGAVTALRWVLLVFDRTDLFVDEAQYWLWGQDFAFGYYSKPPLIAWLIGGVTTLAGSDAPFWVRMPGAALHGATAVVLAALAARIWGGGAALWTAAGYLSLPMVSLGSILISTDTVMAPFFAAALLFWHRLAGDRRSHWAALAGLMAGLAFLAKYAAVYFLLGAGLAALVFPAARVGWRNAGVLLAGFGVVILPNLLWNAFHGLATFSHTADNVGWVAGAGRPVPGLAGLAEFWASQFAVVGPVIFAALLVALARARQMGGLVCFVIVPLVAVSVQSLLDRTNANWAVAAYFAGLPLAMAVLAAWPRLRAAGLAINAAIAVALPVLTLMPALTFGGESPLLKRYLGRAALSAEVIALARAQGDTPIYAEERDVLADLFYTGRGAGLDYYARAPKAAPNSHYEQRYPLPSDLTGPVLAVLSRPTACAPLAPPVEVGRAPGAYATRGLTATLVDGACLVAE
jgi:4-amino-4-deoxy-L-arabinose transferase-like glycosyltransferase